VAGVGEPTATATATGTGSGTGPYGGTAVESAIDP